MLGLRRPYDLFAAFAAGVSLSAVGFHAAPAISTRWPAAIAWGGAMTLPPTIVVAMPEMPSPDSLAMLLVSASLNDAFPRPGSRGETALLLDLVSAAERLASRSDSLAALEEIARLDRLDSAVVSALARSATRLPSWSARERLLRTIIERHSHATAASRRAMLDAISAMPVSTGRAAVLQIFVTRPRLSQAALTEALGHVARLPVGERHDVLIAAARAQRITGPARTIYMKAANGIPRARDRSRALDALRSRSSEHEGFQ